MSDLKRVRETIGSVVLAFCREHLGQTFRMEDLTSYVKEKRGVAPDSPGRILRDLRKASEIDYVLESRSDSLYRIVTA